MILPKRLIAAMLVVSPATWGAIAADGRAESRNGPPAALNGVAHQLYATVSADRASAGQGNADPQARATLTALIRVSDHARESNFFGPVLASFVDIPLGDQTPEQKIWEDKVCHQDRGLPRLVFIGLNGVVRDGERELAISAQPRRIGKLLPPDEIVMTQSLTAGRDQRGAFVMEEGATQQSRISIRLKLYTTPCELLATLQSQP